VSSGVQNWNSQEALDKVTSYAKQGLWGAVGTSEAQLVTNWREQANLQHTNTMAVEDKRHEHALEENKTKNSIPFKSSDGKDYWYNPYQGIFTDDKGNLVDKPKDAPEFLGRFRDKDNDSTDPEKPNKYDLSSVSTMAGATDAGYTLMGIGMKSHRNKGPWEIYGNGDDVSGYGDVDSFFEEHGIIKDSELTFNPNNPADIVLNFDNMNAIRDYIKKGGDLNDIDDLDVDLREAIKAADTHLKTQGFSDGITDDRIRIAITNTPKGRAKFNLLIYRR
jgi:hypothetical protein